MPDVFAALQIYLGSSYVNDFNLFGRTFRVVAQAESDARADTEDVLKIRVRNSTGETVPLGSFTTVRDDHRALSRAALQSLSGGRARRRGGARLFSQGQAIEIMEQLAAQTLPRGLLLTNGRRSPSSRSAPATPRSSPSCWRWCSCSWCWRRSSKA